MAGNFYMDARHRQRKGVAVNFAYDGMRLIDECGILLAFWSYEGLGLIQDSGRQVPYRLTHARAEDAVLMSEDLSLLQKLLKVRPDLNPQGLRRSKSFSKPLALIAGVIISGILFFCAVRFLDSSGLFDLKQTGYARIEIK